MEKADTNLVYQRYKFAYSSSHSLMQWSTGVTLLPQIAVAADVLGDTKLQLKKFNNENVSREIGLAWRKSDPRRENYLLLATFIRTNAVKLQSQ